MTRETAPSEQWRPVVGFEGVYEVSDQGRLRSLTRILTRSNGWPFPVKGRLLVPALRPSGYLAVCLCHNGQTAALVHRLVAAAFIPNPEDLPHVNHLNGIKTDNRVANLEWATPRSNALHAFSHNLRPSKKWGPQPIRCLNNDQVYPSIRAAAASLAICQSNISRALDLQAATKGHRFERVRI